MPNIPGRGRRLLRLAIVTAVAALPAPAAMAQSVSINLAQSGGGQSLASNMVGILAITSILALAPGILVMGTAFTRLVVVLSMLRTALGLQQTPPNTVIISLALFLTGFIMAPSFEKAYHDGVQPLMDGSITEEQAFDRTIKPFRGFMESNTSDKDLGLFINLANWKPTAAADSDTAGDSQHSAPTPIAAPVSSLSMAGLIGGHATPVPADVRTQVPLRVLASAFLVSELSKAFQIGFLLFLPFLVIDIAVSAILMGMGMMMLPPVVVSLPFKLIFFVLVNGWEMVAGSLVRSFSA
jgi:flagellar biosynthetic protein FliP